MHPHRIAVPSWPPSLKDLYLAVKWLREQNQASTSFEFETRDWDDLVARGWSPDTQDGIPYLFGIPVLVYAQGFPQGVIWIRDQSGEVGVELAHECVTRDDIMPNLPVHEYDLHHHPQEFVETARGYLLAGGFTVLTFTRAETFKMARTDGYQGILQRGGYDIRSCEPVWFEVKGDPTGVHLMLGALKIPGR